MCNSPTCQHDTPPWDDNIFAGLDENPRDIGATVQTPTMSPEAYRLNATQFAQQALRKTTSTQTFEEPCRKCRGTGRFVGYTGRVLGQCFECKGEGVKRYKTSPEQRAKGREVAARSKAAKEELVARQAQEWLDANPAEAEWLRRPVTGDFTFHADMLEALRKYGHFTPRQEQAVRSATAKFAAAIERRQAEQAQREAGAAAIDISRIQTALETATRNGLKWAKLRLVGFQFSLAGAQSRNAGAVYVKESETYLGKIIDGRFQRSRDCDEQTQQRILDAAADPEAAAVAYGLQTGICSCCGRELTNKESIARGIGPVCAERWGW